MLFEEIKPNMLERIEDLDRPLEHVLEELMDGDIIVFQKELHGDEDYRLPTSKDYFRDLFYKVRRQCRLILLLWTAEGPSEWLGL
jgi:ubiquitin carboxyl-terminal hydrolase 7